MDKQKEIEKMAYCLCTFPEKYGLPLSCESCGNNGNCVRQKTAEELINKGYGNVRAAVEDVAERIKTAILCEFSDNMTFKMVSRIEKVIDEVCENGH